MTKKRFILLLVIGFVVICPLAAALILTTEGHPPRPLPPLTPIVSPTIFFLFTPASYPSGTADPPTFVPIFATHAVIETQYAATAAALTPAPR
ncbi:MAG: hypothetical protein HND46_18530 [Chloroflexi bacterium]|nr:hypothetical protein [Chloroflexota bacterium]NOG65418.1 hypothetical protein [Chloroflexota bacterium]